MQQFYSTLCICPKAPKILNCTECQWLISKNIFCKSPSVFCCSKSTLLKNISIGLGASKAVATVPSFSWVWQLAVLNYNFCKSPSLFCFSKSTLFDAPALLALLKKWLDCAQHTVILPDWILKNELALFFHCSTAREPLPKLFFEILWEILEISTRMKPDTYLDKVNKWRIHTLLLTIVGL